MEFILFGNVVYIFVIFVYLFLFLINYEGKFDVGILVEVVVLLMYILGCYFLLFLVEVVCVFNFGGFFLVLELFFVEI